MWATLLLSVGVLILCLLLTVARSPVTKIVPVSPSVSEQVTVSPTVIEIRELPTPIHETIEDISNFAPNPTKILILGIVQNVETTFQKSFVPLSKTLDIFTNSEAVIYENNSTDNTIDVLTSIQQARFRFVTEKTPIDTSISRMERIANARNRLLELVSPILQDFQYVLWIDMDGGTWTVSGILDSLNMSSEWDIVACASTYDKYAFRSAEHPYGPEIQGEDWWIRMWQTTLEFTDTIHLHPVYSAFGGMCIYPSHIFTLFRYEALPNPTIQSVYEEILQHPVEFVPNSGYKTHVICEHISIHFAARAMGLTRFMINSRMHYKPCGH